MTFRSRLLSAFSGAVMTFGMVYANLLVLCTVVSIPYEAETLLLLSAVLALTAAVILLTPHPLLGLSVPFFAMGAVFVLCREEAMEEVYRLFVCLSRSPVGGFVFKSLLNGSPSTSELFDATHGTGFFWVPLFAAYVCGSFLILFLSRVRGVLWFSAFDVLFFAALCVFMNTVPSGWLTAFFACLHLALVLSSLLLERASGRAGAVMLGLLLPCFLLAAGLWGALRIYERPAFTDRIVTRSMELYNDALARRRARNGSGGSGGSTGGGAGSAPGEDTLQGTRYVPIGAFPWNRYADRVDLSEVGPRRPLITPVMEIYSDRERTIYLRGVSYGHYDADGWSQNRARVEGVDVFTTSLFVTDAAPEDQLRVRLAVASNLLWLPYTPTELPAGASGIADAYVVSKPVSDYAILYKQNAAFAPVSWEYRNFVYMTYLEVPEETREAIADTVALFDPADPNLVFRIADYVRNCAAYDTDTPAVPRGEDFVSWFLTESDRGYCVHFASAAALLLRCFDIPARYVTGYMVKAEGSGWTEVTENDAHAWVEYFDDSLASWRILEPTPSLADPVEAEAETESAAPLAPLPNLRDESAETEGPRESAPRTEPAAPVRKRSVSLLWLIPAALFAAVVLWPPIRSSRRKASMKKADPNRRVLLLWRLADRLLSLPDADGSREEREACREIALKARFSAHTVTEEEILRTEALLDAAKSSVRKDKNLPRRLAVRWFWGI